MQLGKLGEMWTRRSVLGWVVACCARLASQEIAFDRVAEHPHPRLLLPPRRLRYLRRESQRASPRWVQLQALVEGGALLPEPGFAYSLCWVASQKEALGEQAVRWALGYGSDTRQLALVYDWCHGLLESTERQSLAIRLRSALKTLPRNASIEQARDLTFAAIALAEEDEGAREALHWVVEQWWPKTIVEKLNQGQLPFHRANAYALLEMFHTIRDNLLVDLRLSHRKFFAQLPLYLLLSYYPTPLAASENHYRIPAPIPPASEPDLKLAMLARATDLSLVAYDPNAELCQYLQGWLIQDQFLMRHPFGAPYEFLWANPYLPGLSYYNAPLVYYDPDRALLIARSSWDDDARWFYFDGKQAQAFQEGRIQPLDAASFRQPLELGHSVIVPGFHLDRFQVACERATSYYLVGLKPFTPYEVEVDDEEIVEEKTDRGGILRLEFPEGRKAGVRWRPSAMSESSFC